jgi:hypothetical protein
MTNNMRVILTHLATRANADGIAYGWFHRNTRAALERRGLAVYFGMGRWGVTTLGERAISR